MIAPRAPAQFRARPGQEVALGLLHEEPGLPGWRLPAGLAAAYGGDLGFAEPCTYANFVASLDGVTALGPEYPSSGSAISGREPADRFVMALLRACADAVLIGAGALRATPRHLWTPGHLWPETKEFAALRGARRRPAEPELIVVSARGDLPARHPALRAGTVTATTVLGARRLGRRLPAASSVLVIGDGPMLHPAELLTAIWTRGHVCVRQSTSYLFLRYRLRFREPSQPDGGSGERSRPTQAAAPGPVMAGRLRS